MYSSAKAPRSSSSSFSFLDPTGLDFDLPPDQPTNHITTIHEDDQEEEADYVHIRGAHAERLQDPYYAAPPVAIQEEPAMAPRYPTGGHFYADDTPNRSLTSSPSLPSSYYPPHLQQPQHQQRYQYPRTRASGNGSTGLPLYASRTQRMRNGQSSSLDQSGKPIFRGPSQPRISSGGIGGMSSSSSGSEGDEAYFIGGRRAAGIHKRLSSFRSRRGRPWYKSRQVQIVGFICVLTLIVRLWGIGYPTSVV